jgi:hypothetical protein
MRMLQLTAALTLALAGGVGSAQADPDKDESGKGRWRSGYERSYRYDRDYRPRGRAYGYYGDRRERRAFKQEYDDGNCKVERKWEANGEYKEEVKCRGGRRAYPAYGYYR